MEGGKSVYRRVFEQIRKYSWYRINIISIKHYRLIIFTKEYEYCCYKTPCVRYSAFVPSMIFLFSFFFIFYFFHVTNQQQKLFDSRKKYVCRRTNSFSTISIVCRITVFFCPRKVVLQSLNVFSIGESKHFRQIHPSLLSRPTILPIFSTVRPLPAA